MFCRFCGVTLPEDSTFCHSCGKRLISSEPTLQHSDADSTPRSAPAPPAPSTAASPALGTAAAAQQLLDQPAIPAIASDPPYARFVLSSLVSAVMASVLAFNIADAAARGKWDSTVSTAIATVLCLLLVSYSVKIWSQIKPGSGNEESGIVQRKLRSRNVFFGILFIATGAVMGTLIGTSGAETNHLIEDSHKVREIGDRIAAARNSAARTVVGQVSMYKDIEPDVVTWDSFLRRMQKDLVVYDQKYPADHQNTAASIRSVEIGLKRADLLRRQIALAKEIETLRPEAQWDAWRTRMQPLLDDENALDK